MTKLKCYLDGREREATREEIVRQNYLKILIEDYGYKKEDIKLEYGVKRSPSDTRRSLPVDIAVFEGGKAKIFIETKKPDVESGFTQLKNYMDFDNEVRYGVWTNGTEDPDEVGIKYIEKVFKDGVITYKDIYNIPKRGFYSLDEQIKKKDLIPTNNLVHIFKQMRGFISANATGTTRDEKIVEALMSIVICKIYDERYKTDDDYVDFRVINEDPGRTGKAIRELFEKVKIKYKEVFREDEHILVDDNIITYVVAQLERFSITESSAQIVSDAFESIIGYASKGSQGQFFTPKNVVDLMVTVLDPEEYKYLLDPASGTGGFLNSAMHYVWKKIESKKLELLAETEEKKEYAMKYLYGIEKDDFLAKICKSYMAVLGDGKSGIFVEDSLNEKYWDDSSRANLKTDYFDYVLTNPPFGKDVKMQESTRALYESDKVDLAFVERSLEFLKDGGVLGIILPETVFHSVSNKNIRDSLFYKHNITCLIDLPHDTFRPYNNAKCDVIFLEKNKPQQEKIKLIKIDNIGHNHLGQVVYKYDLETNTFNKNKVNDDIPEIIHAIKNNLKHEKIKEVDSSVVVEEDILVARNYFEEKLNTDNKVKVKDLIDEGIISHFDGHGSPQGHLKGLGDYPYIRVKDIVNLEVYINPLDCIPDFEYERLYREDKQVKPKDIVFVRRGSYRIGDVGIIYPKDVNSIFTRELLILRVEDLENKYNLTPFNLLYLLNSEDVKKQLKNKIMIDTTLPNIADRWQDLYIPIYNKEKMKQLSDEMEKLYNSRKKFWEDFEKISIK